MAERRKRRERRESTKIGMAPGTLIYLGEGRQDKTQLTVFDYNAETLREVPWEELETCIRHKDTPNVTWINIDGLHDVELIEKIGKGFDIHPLVLEDIVNPNTRPKMEDYDAYLFVVVKMLSWNEQTQSIAAEHLCMVLGPSYVLTFQEKGGDVFDAVRERLRANRGRSRKSGPDYLMYALLDAVVDQYFLILEKLDDRIEALEERLLQSVDQTTSRDIHGLRREMIDLRRAVWPMREVIGNLSRDESPLVQRDTRIYLRDVYDHTVQIVETVETFRDLLSGLLDIYMSTLNIRMNNVMKVLTIISTIFIPLTFIAGVYGMNFENMPELHKPWAYPAVLVFMLGVGLVMLALFKKRGWF